MERVKVVIADDQIFVREGIKYLIEKDSDIEVVGCAGNGKEAYDLCLKTSPHVVLMDVMMPLYDGIEGTRLIKSFSKDIKVLILSTFSDEENVSKAMNFGADGYVLKDIGPEELKSSIKNTLHGLRVIHHNVFDTILKGYTKSCSMLKDPLETDMLMKTPAKTPAKKYTLTEREKSIIQLIIYGKSNKEIAQSINLSEGRVKNLITTILEKVELKDRTQLAVFAVKNKLLT